MVSFTYKRSACFKTIRAFLGALWFLMMNTGALVAEATQVKPFAQGNFLFNANPVGKTFKFLDLNTRVIYDVSVGAIRNYEELSAQVPAGTFEYALKNNIPIPATLDCVSSCQEVRKIFPVNNVPMPFGEIQGQLKLTFDPKVMQFIAASLPKPQVQKPIVDNPTLGAGLTKFTSDKFVFDRFDAREGFVYLRKENQTYKVSSRQLNPESPRPSIQVMSWASELKGKLPLPVTLTCSSVICSYRSVKNVQGQDILVLENGKYVWDFDWNIINKIAQTKDVILKAGDMQDLNLVGADAQNLYFVDKNDPLAKKHVLKKNAVKNISDFLLRASGSTSQDLKYSIECIDTFDSENGRQKYCMKSVFVPKDGNNPYYEMKGLFTLNAFTVPGTYDPTKSKLLTPVNYKDLKFHDMNDQYYIFNNQELVAPSPKYPNEEKKVSMMVTYLVPKANVQIVGGRYYKDLSDVLPPDLFAYWKAKYQKTPIFSIKCMDPKVPCNQSMDKTDDGRPFKYLTGQYIMTPDELRIDDLKASYEKVTGKTLSSNVPN